jgi:hypothetical protein
VTRQVAIEPLCVTVPEAARAIRRSENEVRVWVRQGVLPHIRWAPTSHPLIPLAALRKFVDDHTVTVAAMPSSTTTPPPPPVGEGTGTPEPGPDATRPRAATRGRAATTSGRGRTVPAGHAGSKDRS